MRDYFNLQNYIIILRKVRPEPIIIAPVFKEALFGVQTRLLFIANKASFVCKQDLFKSKGVKG